MKEEIFKPKLTLNAKTTPFHWNETMCFGVVLTRTMCFGSKRHCFGQQI